MVFNLALVPDYIRGQRRGFLWEKCWGTDGTAGRQIPPRGRGSSPPPSTGNIAEMAERAIAADCKSVALTGYPGSNPGLSTKKGGK